MKKYLILIAGPPATGKTYLIDQITNILERSIVITPDEFKIDMAESVGFNNLNEKQKLEVKVWEYYYSALALYMGVGKRFILSEYPFSDKQKGLLKELAEKNDYIPITIRLVADFETLWERRRERDIEESRHLSLIMNKYHYGDTLVNRSEADALITKEEFRQIISDRKYNEFQLGEIFEFDVTDFTKVDFNELFHYLEKL